MDFEYTIRSVDTSPNALEARGFLWLLKYLLNQIDTDFDTRLSNRLRLSSTILSEVLIDIGLLVDASVLTKSNKLHKRSLISLLNWLYDYLDGRQSELTNSLVYLRSLNSKLVYQIKIFPTVLVCAYYSGPTNTTIYASIKSSRRQSLRLQHLLDFDTLIKQTELQSGNCEKLFHFSLFKEVTLNVQNIFIAYTLFIFV